MQTSTRPSHAEEGRGGAEKYRMRQVQPKTGSKARRSMSLVSICGRIEGPAHARFQTTKTVHCQICGGADQHPLVQSVREYGLHMLLLPYCVAHKQHLGGTFVCLLIPFASPNATHPTSTIIAYCMYTAYERERELSCCAGGIHSTATASFSFCLPHPAISSFRQAYLGDLRLRNEPFSAPGTDAGHALGTAQSC